jgi:glycosyltransferase involved in cell wall biosynthesis
MRIGIDATFIVPGRVGGAEQMAVAVVEGVREAAAGDHELTVISDHPWPSPAVRFRSPSGRGPRFPRIALTLAGRRRYDAVLFTNYFTPPVPKRGARWVTVIHDLQYRHHPEYFSARKRAWLRAAHEATLRWADRVVTISEDVRDDVLRSYGRRWAPKVIAIHNPVDWERFGSDETPPDEDERPYVLSVAAQYPHKNLHTLITAFARVSQVHPDLRLVLVGQLGSALRGIAWYRPVEDVIGRLGLADRVLVTGYVDDRTLGAWYRGARLFAFPSLFEGFAQPPVEALGFGLPVLASGRTSIPETTRGLARLLDDPTDAAAMADAMLEILADPASARPTAGAVGARRAGVAPGGVGRRDPPERVGFGRPPA